MRLVTFTAPGEAPRPGLWLAGGILPLPFASLLDFLASGAPAWEAARKLAETAGSGGSALIPQAEITLLAPIPRPPTLRDFYAFEQHVRAAHRIRAREIPPEWYQFPVFYFSNPASLFGPGAVIPFPQNSREWDFELEVAAVIGVAGSDIAPANAPAHIFGYTIFNDWSARDLQRAETKVGLGPAKGKDFASSLGPCIVSADELAAHAAGRPGVFHLSMRACLNGEEIARGNWADIHYSFGELIARASQDACLYPGDVIGSGTVGSGCLLERTRGAGPWLQPGDTVTLEIEHIGALHNVIGERKNVP